MGILKKIFYTFSQYTDPAERKIGKFLSHLNEDNSRAEVAQSLLKQLQPEAARFNLFCERRYKGYRYLKKSTRRRLYQNLSLIEQDFSNFCQGHVIQPDDVISQIKMVDKAIVGLPYFKEKLSYIKQIMDYLSPRRGLYSYRESSSFGEMLKDPAGNNISGDCNQIVTMYIYLYSRKYDISDLQLLAYPGHVALHFQGIGIEATNGEFKHYDVKDQHILPVQEIVSINLLDISDRFYPTNSIDVEAQLQSARLALLVSSNQELVRKNLEITYNNAANKMMAQNDFFAALRYARQSKDLSLIQIVGHNGAISMMNSRRYKDAEKLAQFANDKQKLLDSINYNHAIDLYNKGDYQSALSLLKRVGGHQDLINKCYIGLFFDEQKKLGNIQTVQDIKNNKATINNMSRYAKLSSDIKLIEYVKRLTKHL